MIGLFKLLRLLFSLVNPATNALSSAPLEWKYLATNVLAFLWCVSFGVYVGEYVMIGYSIIGHIALISMCFLTYYLMRHSRQNFDINTDKDHSE
ncbi:MAG: hypothetical protein RI539_07260 [Spiribacter sp.]|jgi:O-antigen/teichoic acid export membrane protein|nr:hypothetical protein [Spiribacter sp.]MDR9490123.1 hypothetical protein [Spiribacter sp.]